MYIINYKKDIKSKYSYVLIDCFCLPCICITGIPGLICLNDSYKNLTSLQLLTNTNILCFKWLFINEYKTFIFSSIGITIYFCISCSGVATSSLSCTPIYSGLFKLNFISYNNIFKIYLFY